MSMLSSKLRSLNDNQLAFFCPGCKESHVIAIGEGKGPRWTYNNNPELPTFSPSILVRWNEPPEKEEDLTDRSKYIPQVCHSFVTNGQIQFLNDCTHELAGKTVELPDYPPPKHIPPEHIE